MKFNLGCGTIGMFDENKTARQYVKENTEFLHLLNDINESDPNLSEDAILAKVCKRYNFDPKHDVPLHYHHEFNIPLDGFGVVRECKQFVLGRVWQLRPFYVREDSYVTLTVPDEIWSDKFSFSLEMNDLFIHCAADAKKRCKDKGYVPIRIVLDEPDLEYFERDIENQEELRKIERKRTQRRFNRTERGLTMVFDEKKKTAVLARELCQLTNVLKMKMYQSKEYPTVFFMDYGKSVLDNNRQFERVEVV